MRPHRGASALIVLALSAALLVGCTGDGQVGQFKRAFSGDPAVASMELTSHDNQPFTGGVSGEVFARDGLDDESFSALAERISEYTAQHGEEMRGLVSLVVDGYRLRVTGDAAADSAAVDTLLALRADDRVRSAGVGESSIGVVAADTDAAVSVARGLPSPIDSDVADSFRFFRVSSEDGAIDIGGELPDLANALATWDALDIDVPLQGMRLSEGSLVVTLQHEADFGRAQQLVAAMPDGGTTPRLASDLVRLGLSSDGSRARELLSRLDAEVLPKIAWVWESDTRLQVAVRGGEDPEELIDILSDALPAGTTDATVRTADDVDSSIDIPLAAAAR